MKLLPLTAILTGLWSARAQNQTIATWFSTSTASLNAVSTWKVVQYGSTPVTPIPTVRSGVTYETVVVHEPTRSRNINLTTTLYMAQVTFPVKSQIVTVYQTVIGIPTVSANGTSTVASWVTPTVATVTFTPTVCANNGSLPKTTVTRYTGDYTPFPGQIITPTRTSFPIAVTSYVKVISHSRIFAYTGTTVLYTSTVTATNWLSTTSLTTTVTTTWNPFSFSATLTHYSTTTTTTTSSWFLAHTAIPTTTLCSSGSTATVTYDARCAPSNLISERENRGVAVRWLSNEWSIPLTSRFNSDLLAEATRDPTVCCQLCVDNPGCAASEWKRSWNDGCRVYYFNTVTDSSRTMGRRNETTTCGELEYYGDSHEFPGQASFLQVGCGRLKYIGGRNPDCPTCALED